MMPCVPLPSAVRVRSAMALLTWVALWGCGAASTDDAGSDDGQVVEEQSPSPVVDTVEGAEPPVDEQEVKDDGHVVGALETYRYWAGQDPDADMQVLNGEYWASAHWSREYSLYMELKFPRGKDFVMGQGFKRAEQWHERAGAPDWFKPPEHYELWEGEQGSLYYIHPKKGHLYMFERRY